MHALTVGVPEIDAGTFQPCAIFDGSNLQGKCKRRASPRLGNVGAHEIRVEIEWTLHGLRREDAHVRAWERGGEALFVEAPLRREASASGEAEAERCRGPGQGLAARQADLLVFTILAHDLHASGHRDVTLCCLALSLSRCIMASMREGLDAANRKTFDPGLCRRRARRADLPSEPVVPVQPYRPHPARAPGLAARPHPALGRAV